MATIKELEENADARALASMREQMSKMVMDWLLSDSFREWMDNVRETIENAKPKGIRSAQEIAEFSLASDINNTIAENRPRDNGLWSDLNGFAIEFLIDTGWIARQLIHKYELMKYGL